MRDPFYCLHCRVEVVTATNYGGGGTYWTHIDGYQDCKPTYAAPNMIPVWEKQRQEKLASGLHM